MMPSQAIPRLRVSGAPLTGSNLYDAIALAIVLIGLIAFSPLVLARYRAELPSYVIQAAAIVAFYTYARSFGLPERYREWPQRLLLLVSFTIPLEQTFFPQALAKLLWLIDSHVGMQLFRVSNVLLFIVVVLAFRSKASRSALRAVPMLIKVSFVIGLAGFALATIVSAYPSQSLATGVLEFLPVYCVMFALFAIAPDRSFMRHACALFVLACLAVAITQLMALARVMCCDNTFYLPATLAEFLAIKFDLELIRAISLNGYGNPGHYGSLTVLLTPCIAGYIYSRHGSKLAIPALFLVAYSFLLFYSRSGVLLISIGLATVFALLIWRYRTFASAILVVLAVFVFVHSSKEALTFYTLAMRTFTISLAGPDPATDPKATPTIAPEPASKSAVGPPNPPSPPQSTSEALPPSNAAATPKLESDATTAKNKWQKFAVLSGHDRAKAWQLGLEISKANWLTGLGYSVYRLTEPIYSAPHSLLLKRWAEGGILSVISIILFAAYAPLRLAQLLRQRQPSIFEFGCLVGVTCFFVQAFIFGMDLSIGGVIVWGYGIGMFLAVSRTEADDVPGGLYRHSKTPHHAQSSGYIGVS